MAAPAQRMVGGHLLRTDRGVPRPRRPSPSVMKHKRPDGVVCAHHDLFSPPGQQLYRWRVERLLTRHGIGLRLAGDGEEAGRLVGCRPAITATGSSSAFATPDAAARRPSGTQSPCSVAAPAAGQKPGAILALAGRSEQRRALLDAQLLSKDENALFQIANEFDLRHRRADQRRLRRGLPRLDLLVVPRHPELTNQLLLRPAL